MFESFERQKVDTREHGNVVKLDLYVPEIVLDLMG